MRIPFLIPATAVLCIAMFCVALFADAKGNPANAPGCTRETAKKCVDEALQAMGGRDRLEQLHTVRLKITRHTLLMEQSYRQSPFITSYERGQITLAFSNHIVLSQTSFTWPVAQATQSAV